MKVICIGYNCACTIIGREMKILKECYPFDWGFSSPSSISRVLSSLYIDGVDKTLHKIMKFEPGYTHENYVKDFGLYYPHYSINDREKFKRRLERLLSALRDTSEETIFLYTSPAHHTHYFDYDGQWLTKDVYEDIKKLYNIISLFRPPNTFRIIFVDSEYTLEHKQSLDGYNIHYIQGDPVETERFWIYPCIDKIRYVLKKYNIL